MQYAVIETGGKQYLVQKGQELDIELLKKQKKLEFAPLLVFGADGVEVGQPLVNGVNVTAEVVEPIVKDKKLQIMKFKAKKRVKTRTGHRQKYTRIKIASIGGGAAKQK